MHLSQERTKKGDRLLFRRTVVCEKSSLSPFSAALSLTRTAALVLLVACARTPPAPELRVVQRFLHGATESSPLIVALHGRGDSPDNFARLFEGFPMKVEVVLPQGLEPSGSGHQWFDMSGLALDDAELDRRIAAAEAKLWPALVKQAQGRKLIVVGFSQGAVMSYALAARHPTEVIAAFPISGWAPPLFTPQHNTPSSACAPIHALHGTADDVVPVALARQAERAFSRPGSSMDLREFEGARHEVNAEMRAYLFARIVSVLPP